MRFEPRYCKGSSKTVTDWLLSLRDAMRSTRQNPSRLLLHMENGLRNQKLITVKKETKQLCGRSLSYFLSSNYGGDGENPCSNKVLAKDNYWPDKVTSELAVVELFEDDHVVFAPSLPTCLHNRWLMESKGSGVVTAYLKKQLWSPIKSYRSANCIVGIANCVCSRFA